MFQQFLLFSTGSWVFASFLTLPLLVGLFLCLRQKLFLWRRDVLVLFLFVIFFLVSFYFRLQPYGYNEFIAFMVGPLLFLVFQQRNAAQWAQQHSLKISWMVSFIGAFLSLWGIIFFVFEPFSRLSGFFKGIETYTTYPNTFAFFLIMTIPFGIFLGISFKKWDQKKILAFFLLTLQMVAFLLTFSRGAVFSIVLAAIAVSFLFVRFYLRRRTVRFIVKKSLLWGIFLSFILLLSFIINELHRSFQPILSTQVPLTEDVIARFSDQQTSADQSTDERIQFWTHSFYLMQLNPFFGIGSDGFRFQYPRFQVELLATSTHPHNLFLKIAVENGIPAALFLFLFFFIIGKDIFLQLWRGKNEKFFYWKSALFFSSLAAVSHSMVDYNLNAMLPWLLFWFIFSIIPLSLKAVKIKRVKAVFLNMILMFGILTFFILSIAYAWNYNLIKNAQRSLEAGDAKKFEASISEGFYFPFEPLQYELLSDYVRKYSLEAVSFVYPFVRFGIEKYPEWAEIRIAQARLFFAEGKFLEAAEAYEQALALNSLNEFSWHKEYIHSLIMANFFDHIQLKDDFYFSLLSAYVQKLRFNEHNTVATSNPADAYELLVLYTHFSSPQRKSDWLTLLSHYQYVWQLERFKFRELFKVHFP